MSSSSASPVFHGKAITVCCTDPRGSERFYVDVLGAVRLPDDGHGGCHWYQLGALTVSLVPNADSRNPAELGQHAMTTLWLGVDDIEAAHRHLASTGCELNEVPDAACSCSWQTPTGSSEIWQRERLTLTPRTPIRGGCRQ